MEAGDGAAYSCNDDGVVIRHATKYNARGHFLYVFELVLFFTLVCHTWQAYSTELLRRAFIQNILIQLG